jgi:hypothetical protein
VQQEAQGVSRMGGRWDARSDRPVSRTCGSGSKLAGLYLKRWLRLSHVWCPPHSAPFRSFFMQAAASILVFMG